MITSWPVLQGLRILIVEDEFLVAMAVEDLLELRGCSVLGVASTVDEALRRIGQDGPEFVILDRNLNGTHTTKVAEDLTTRQIPFLVMTGYVSGIVDDPAMRSAPYIAKPWNNTTLLDGLAGALEESRRR